MDLAMWLEAAVASAPISILLIGLWYVLSEKGRRARLMREREIGHQEGLLKGFDEGYGQGWDEAVDEIEEMREERNVGYREAAHIVGKRCAVCSRKCLHCAKAAIKERQKTVAKMRVPYDGGSLKTPPEGVVVSLDERRKLYNKDGGSGK